MHDTPAALEQEFTPDVEQPHATARRSVADVRRGGWTRARIAWTIVGVIFLAWAVWAFVEDGTAVRRARSARVWRRAAVVALAALGFLVIMKATGIANFAQGDLITLGAFLGVWATDQVGARPRRPRSLARRRLPPHARAHVRRSAS